MDTHTGQCACGRVRYQIKGDLGGVVSCHCKMCQRLHGNYNPMVIVEKTAITFIESTGFSWFDSSDIARRGFCKECGSAIFKEQKTGSKILVSVGSLDDTTELKNIKNVFTKEAGSYYPMPGGSAE